MKYISILKDFTAQSGKVWSWKKAKQPSGERDRKRERERDTPFF